MTDDPISRIEAALGAGPTPGPWSSGHTQPHTMIYCRDGWAVADACAHHGMYAKTAQVATAAFIAACNPTAIRALLDQLKAAERRAEYWKAEHLAANAEVERLSAEIERLREVLERLARLGNGDRYGNSNGNMIARAALENTDAR